MTKFTSHDLPAHQDTQAADTSCAVGAASPKPSETCQTMIEVREGVDALDRALVELLVKRQGYMDAAARIKGTREAVRDVERIEDVVAKVKAYAQDQGLTVSIAEPVWRELIERSIAYEFVKWDELKS